MIKRFIRRVFGLPSEAMVRVPRAKHGLSREALSPAAAKVCSVLRETGYSGYVVGGAVRDLLLGIVPKDFDIATDARPEQIKPLFRRALIIGRRFRLVHVMMGSDTVEVSTFRAADPDTAEKDEHGSGAWDEEGVVQLATRAIKQAQPELLVITDVCLCEYTAHGHCGVLRDDGAVDNDATVELLAQTAVSHARAGADLVAPSDMMDGRVGAIRQELDGEGFSETPILAYSAKFASAFYGPFREAAGSTPAFGDRRSYQMDSANGEEAVREALLDVQEGADMVMVKPALAYGDVISAVKRATHLPVAAYNVSGEYAMVKAAAAAGYLDERATVLEILTSLRRAGADTIISYHAKDAARWLAEQT